MPFKCLPQALGYFSPYVMAIQIAGEKNSQRLFLCITPILSILLRLAPRLFASSGPSCNLASPLFLTKTAIITGQLLI